MNPETVPLMCRMTDNNGKPIKTQLAAKLPNLTRRERRALARRITRQLALAQKNAKGKKQ